MHYHSVLASLTETALFSPLPSRSATLHTCLISTHAFLSSLFSVPTLEYYRFSYVSWMQLLHVLGVLSKLSRFESDDWDLSHVRGVLDLGLVLEGLIGKFRELEGVTSNSNGGGGGGGGLGGDDGPKNGLFERVIPRFELYKREFEEKREALAARWRDSGAGDGGGGGGPGRGGEGGAALAGMEMGMEEGFEQVQFDPEMLADVVFSQPDEAFWTELMGDWGVVQGY